MYSEKGKNKKYDNTSWQLENLSIDLFIYNAKNCYSNPYSGSPSSHLMSGL